MKRAFLVVGLFFVMATCVEAQQAIDTVFRAIFARNATQLSINTVDINMQEKLNFSRAATLKEVGLAKRISWDWGFRYNLIIPGRETTDTQLGDEFTFNGVKFGSKASSVAASAASQGSLTSEFYFGVHRLNLDAFTWSHQNNYTFFPTIAGEIVQASLTFKGGQSGGSSGGSTTQSSEVSEVLNRGLLGGGVAGYYSDRLTVLRYEALYMAGSRVNHALLDVSLRYKENRGFIGAGYRYSNLKWSFGDNNSLTFRFDGPYVEAGVWF